MEILRKMPIKCSWEDLKKAADNGTLKEVLSSGDQISVTLKDGREIILDVGKDKSGKYYFVCHDCIAECTMNRKSTNKGGWRDSDARAFLITEVLSLFPDDIQATMKPTKITQVWRGETLKTEDRLFLLSRTQMFGKDGRYAAVDSGDSQIDIFATDCDRVKGFDFVDEVKAFRDYDRIVEEQAQAWRNAHPLEEKIRVATESKNCVDIAEVIHEITKGESTNVRN